MKHLHFTVANIFVKGLLTSSVYGLLVYLSTIFIFPVTNGPVIWSVNAFPVAVLLFNRDKNWPIILFFCAIGLLASQLPTGLPEITPSLVLWAINLFEIFLLALIIRKTVGTTPTRKKLKSLISTSIWATALAIMITTILSVVLFSAVMTDINFIKTGFRVFTSAYLGQLLLLPAVLCYIIPDQTSPGKKSTRKIIEFSLMWAILLFIVTVTLVSLNSQTQLHYIFPYLTFSILVWTAFRFGIRITLTCSIITSLFTKYLASLGYAPFGTVGFSSYGQVAEMNVGLIALNATIVILAIIIDNQKQIKSDLAKREEWFEIAINHMSGGLYLLDRERRFKVLSTNLINKFGLPPEICHLGAHIKQVFTFRAERGDYGPGDTDEMVRQRMEDMEKPETTHGHNTPPGGRRFEYFQNHTKDDEIIVIYHDITERIKAEEDSKKALMEALKANKAKTDFLANMSHELRTPLNAIIGFSEIMSQDKFAETSADKVREYSKDIHMSGHHLLNIINDILDLSKVEAGMADIELESIPLGKFLKECVTFLDMRAAAAEITIFNEAKDTDTVIQADRRMFKQIMINLLSNSVKFTPPGGSIHISHKVNDTGETTISVADTGIGIDGSEIESMMEPFRQADSSLSREFEGTGLGLPLVKSLMELHDGRVKIKSTLGVGTTVLITFPPHI
ncbi:MAG: hypothetical protein COB49_02700 [Alphaproteobacteria bacterium]|nr:MAG: hypothetical protein COB49_02700 [Alphaproteobacteria bacterium]